MSNPHSSVVRILQDLIRCPSVTPDEGGALAYLEHLLSAVGFTVHRITFSDRDTPDVQNLFATIGSACPHLVFAGHTDVVPPGDTGDWSHPPFGANIIDDMIFGRGAVDMKGGIACFVAAALAFIEAQGGDFDGSLSFLITGDEEGPAVNGTEKLLRWAEENGFEFDACILGEPTNPNELGDAIKVGRRGSLSGVITVEGVQGHVAYPENAQNPISGLLALLSALDAIEFDCGNDRFQPSNLEIVTIDVGNTAFNVIPAKAEARFNVRFNDAWSLNTLKAKIEQILEMAAPSGVSWSLAFRKDASESFVTRNEVLISTLSHSIEAITNRRPELSTGGGTSDARFIKNYCPVVEFGLVGQTMHKVDEYVAVDDLERLTAIYQRFIQDYFAEQTGV